MIRAISNVDTDFLEELTAVASTQEDLCLLLAEKVDTSEMMELVREILLRANKIGMVQK